MGVVWLARDEVFGRDVAIKEVLLPPQLQEKEREAVFQRTRREARVAARLSHPNVVKVYDVIEYDNRPWIVMELVRARSLTEVVEQSGPLAPQRVAAIGLQVLSGLTAAHAAGITHRDVKPGNVLCADNGRVVLTDFGIASVADDPSVTMHGVLMGSPAYIAPERVRGGPARAASDLWSLAATLYAAVEGRPPYDRGAAVPTVTAVVNEDPDPLQRAGVLGPVLEQIFVKDPDARPDADTIRALLREVASTPESETEVAATVALKREASTAAAAAAPVASATAPATKATATKLPDAAVPAQRRRAPLVVAAFSVGCLLIGGTALQNMASQADEDKRSVKADTVDTTPSPTPSPAEPSPSAPASPSTSPTAVPSFVPDDEDDNTIPVRTQPRPNPTRTQPKPTPTTPKPTPTPTKSPTKPPPTTRPPSPDPTPSPEPTPTASPPGEGSPSASPDPTDSGDPAEPVELPAET
jgi:eukaryotic-like serine/threonine-protein kinase